MAESQESMYGAMDSAWLCLCGALVTLLSCGWLCIVQTRYWVSMVFMVLARSRR